MSTDVSEGDSVSENPNGRAPIILRPGEGREYAMGNIRAVFKADGDETGQGYSISEWWMEPHTKGPGAHQHPEDNTFFVVEGVMSLLVGERWVEAPVGTFVLVPGGVVHDFENRSDARAGFLTLVAPAGFEKQMPAIAEYWAKNPPGEAR